MGTARGAVELAHGEVTREIIGAFFDVHNELGAGFVEAVYRRALPIALRARGLRCEREVAVSVTFRGENVGDYRADLIVEGRVVVETKVAEKLLPVHEVQLLNYLKATGLTVGLLLNFGSRAAFRRLILSQSPRGEPRGSADVQRESAVSG